MLYVNCITCSMEMLDFDNLSNLKYKPTKNIRKKISLQHHLLQIHPAVSIAHVSTKFANAENIPCSFSKLPVVFLVSMELNLFS